MVNIVVMMVGFKVTRVGVGGCVENGTDVVVVVGLGVVVVGR